MARPDPRAHAIATALTRSEIPAATEMHNALRHAEIARNADLIERLAAAAQLDLAEIVKNMLPSAGAQARQAA